MFPVTRIFTFSISVLLIQVALSTPIKSLKGSDNLVIRHVESGLVVDGKEHYVKLQEFTNSSSQFWKPVEVSMFVYIVYNNETNLALSVEGMFRNGSKIITEPHTWSKQEWVLTQNNFVVFLTDSYMILDVEDATSYMGANLVINEMRYPTTSKFELEYV